MKVWLRDKKLKLRYIKIGIRNIFKTNIGDIVIYNNEKYVVTNGVTAPVLNITELKTRIRLRINSSEFKKEVSFRNIKNAIGGTYRFYKGYWHDIWLRGDN